MFVPYWYEMSGCWFALDRDGRLLQRVVAVHVLELDRDAGLSASNALTIRSIDRYSNDWFSGGGGV